MNKDNYELKTYGVGSIYIEDGMYTEKEVKDMLQYFEVMNERARQLAQDLIDAQIDKEVSK